MYIIDCDLYDLIYKYFTYLSLGILFYCLLLFVRQKLLPLCTQTSIFFSELGKALSFYLFSILLFSCLHLIKTNLLFPFKSSLYSKFSNVFGSVNFLSYSISLWLTSYSNVHYFNCGNLYYLKKNLDVEHFKVLNLLQ